MLLPISTCCRRTVPPGDVSHRRGYAEPLQPHICASHGRDSPSWGTGFLCKDRTEGTKTVAPCVVGMDAVLVITPSPLQLQTSSGCRVTGVAQKRLPKLCLLTVCTPTGLQGRRMQRALSHCKCSITSTDPARWRCIFAGARGAAPRCAATGIGQRITGAVVGRSGTVAPQPHRHMCSGLPPGVYSPGTSGPHSG